jgi:hypothetical protein
LKNANLFSKIIKKDSFFFKTKIAKGTRITKVFCFFVLFVTSVLKICKTN